MENKQKHTYENIQVAQDSLEEILKRISPYIPKTPKVKETPRGEWKLSISGELPPLNSIAK